MRNVESTKIARPLVAILPRLLKMELLVHAATKHVPRTDCDLSNAATSRLGILKNSLYVERDVDYISAQVVCEFKDTCEVSDTCPKTAYNFSATFLGWV